MSMSKPKVPDPQPAPPPPAQRPERTDIVTADDVQMGVQDEGDDTTKRGKRSLARPAPAGVGLSV